MAASAAACLPRPPRLAGGPTTFVTLSRARRVRGRMDAPHLDVGALRRLMVTGPFGRDRVPDITAKPGAGDHLGAETCDFEAQTTSAPGGTPGQQLVRDYPVTCHWPDASSSGALHAPPSGRAHS